MPIIMIFLSKFVLYLDRCHIVTKTCVTENPENILRFLLQTRVLKNPTIKQCTMYRVDGYLPQGAR